MRAFFSTQFAVWRGGPRLGVGLVRVLALLAVFCAVTQVTAAPSLPSKSAAPGHALIPVRSFPITFHNGDVADVYMPRIPAAARRIFEDAFPVVAVLQGALVDKSHYEQLGKAIARQGFVVVIPNHFRSFPPFPGQVLFSEVDVVTAVYEAMMAEDAARESPLYRIIDTDTMGLIGHSLGGGVGLYALAGICVPAICTDPSFHYTPPPALRAAVVYGTNLVASDGSVTDLNTAGVAVALIQGSLDGVALPEKAEPSYATLEQPRALIEIAGANHYGICDENNPPGARPDASVPTLTQAQANDYVNDWIGLWLRAQLRDDHRAQHWIERFGGSRDGVVTVVTD